MKATNLRTFRLVAYLNTALKHVTKKGNDVLTNYDERIPHSS